MKEYSIASILYPSLNSSQTGISADLFFQGCKNRCPGCHNPELQEFKEPNTSIQDVQELIQAHKIHTLTLMGGEPMDVPMHLLARLVACLKQEFPKLKVGMFTGKDFEEIPASITSLLDSVKTGRYRQDLPTPRGSWLASTNQKYFQKGQDGWKEQKV